MTKNGDRLAIRIQIFDGEKKAKVYDFTSPLDNPKKQLKEFSLVGYGGENYYQLMKTGQTEYKYDHFRVQMDLIAIQDLQVSQNP
jgi:hypothetical protein